MFTDVSFFRTQFATYCTSKPTFIPSRRLFTIVQKSTINVVITGNIFYVYISSAICLHFISTYLLWTLIGMAAVVGSIPSKTISSFWSSSSIICNWLFTHFSNLFTFLKKQKQNLFNFHYSRLLSYNYIPAWLADLGSALMPNFSFFFPLVVE